MFLPREEALWGVPSAYIRDSQTCWLYRIFHMITGTQRNITKSRPTEISLDATQRCRNEFTCQYHQIKENAICLQRLEMHVIWSSACSDGYPILSILNAYIKDIDSVDIKNENTLTRSPGIHRKHIYFELSVRDNWSAAIISQCPVDLIRPLCYIVLCDVEL